MKRTALKRGTKPLSRGKGLRPVSAKRRAQSEDRRDCVMTVIARDKTCQVWEKAAVAGIRVPPCMGPLTAHEPAHRRNSDITDPSQCLACCSFHNQWVESNPELGYAIGVLVRANGRPLRNVETEGRNAN